MHTSKFNLIALLILWLSLAGGVVAADSTSVHVELPRHRILPHELAVIVNQSDPLSTAIGDYYIRARSLPAENLVKVKLPTGTNTLSAAAFADVKQKIDKATAPHIQAYAITWVEPFRVECMSITSAIAFGFDKAWCSKETCAPTRHSRYFKYPYTKPFDDLGIRPVMSIAATSFQQARALIDRGIGADNTHPRGTAYLLNTSDKARSVRSVFFEPLKTYMQGWIATEVLHGNHLKDRDDVLFYFTGSKWVKHLDSLNFLPGAIADHLTSTGGVLTGEGQMSALRWLEAGATGSYGTVVEPCNLLGKFPHPPVLMDSYGSGRTLIEAYWQSVQQPGEGLFIGEPLAAPFSGFRYAVKDGHIHLHTRQLLPGHYTVTYATSPVGPYQPLPQQLEVKQHQTLFRLPLQGSGYYRIQHPRTTALNRAP